MRRMRLRSRLADDRGVAMPIIAGGMVVILAAAALTVDMGNGWRTRRALIPATDAGALAAAQDFVVGTNGCTNDRAADYVDFNHAAATMTDCTPNVGSDRGWVSVTAEEQLDTFFASVVGLNQYTVESTSIAAWGPPATVTGLRPIGLCINAIPEISNLITNPPSTPQIIEIDYDFTHPDPCGGGDLAGNWGIVDFNGGSNPSPDAEDWIEFGYDGQVTFENHTVTSCVSEPHCYEVDPSNFGANFHDELDHLILNNIYFTLPVINFGEGTGGTAKYHIMGILRVRLLAYQTTGPQTDQFFRLEVFPGLITGTCCGSGGNDGGSKVITICGVDPNQTAGCP